MLHNSDKFYKINYPNNINGILDSGSTGNFITTTTPQCNTKMSHAQLKIKQPDESNMLSKHKSELTILQELSKKAREAYAFDKITFPLISIAKLCDDNCAVLFLKSKAVIMRENKVTAKAPRDHISKLWIMSLKIVMNALKHMTKVQQ